jgi:hypothetical protein
VRDAFPLPLLAIANAGAAFVGDLALLTDVEAAIGIWLRFPGLPFLALPLRLSGGRIAPAASQGEQPAQVHTPRRRKITQQRVESRAFHEFPPSY